jgi:glycosyltransferase involved in cell wall biosynthesis
VTRTIAHVLPFPAVGGTEHATLRIAKAVDRSRFTSVPFCLQGADPVTALFADEGFQCATYEPAQPSYRRGREYLRASRALAAELRRRHVDLVHCADLLAAYHVSLAGWLAAIPVLCHIRGRFDRMSFKDCSFLWTVRRFVFVSQSTWQHFGCRVPPQRGVVVYDGIDIPPPGECHDARESIHREFNIPETAPVIGMLARVAPQKDFATLAKAAVRVLQVQPQARFLIVGDYSSSEVYRELYQQVSRMLAECGVSASFIFTGHRNDVARLLSGIDIFVLSTHREGLPLVILEAMAHGKPVVATAVDGIPEIIQDGETGLLFAHEDHEQLSAQIIALLQDPARGTRLGTAGRTLVQTRFSTEQFGANMSAVYASVLAAP